MPSKGSSRKSSRGPGRKAAASDSFFFYDNTKMTPDAAGRRPIGTCSAR
jgi:hypothetical protein